jgi:hypothetical protein
LLGGSRQRSKTIERQCEYGGNRSQRSAMPTRQGRS